MTQVRRSRRRRAGRHLRDDRSVTVGLLDLERVLDEVDDGEIRDVAAVRDAAADEPGCVVRADSLAKLIDEPRLADSGVPREEDDLPRAGLRALEPVEQRVELTLAADVRRKPTRCRD